MTDIDSNLPTRDLADGADGSSAPSVTQQIGGVDNLGNLQTVSVDTAGKVNVNSTAQPGVDIGDVTVNNGSGASAVNIQDGGNSITVDGTIAATQSGSWTVTANAGTNLNTSALALASTQTDGTQKTQVTVLPALVAGTAIIGKVGIDQTTPGTTNGVQINAALPAGTNSIGQVTANAGTNLNTSALSLETTQSSIDGKLTTSNTNTGNTATSTASIDTKISTVSTRIGDLTETAPATDTASSGLNGRLQRIAQRLTSLISTVATETSLGTLLTRTGDVTETAPATDTASSGLNGRLQRIAQRLTTLISTVSTETTLAALSAKFNSLGQKTMANSAPFVIASDQSDIPVRTKDSSGTGITSTLINSKQRLDINTASEGTDGSTAPFQTVQVGGKDGNGNLQAVLTDTSGNVFTNSQDSLGQAQYNFPAGFVRVTDEPTQIFYDPFDSSLDVSNRWMTPVSAGGGVAAAVSAGNLTLGSGTTASGYSYLQSQPVFIPPIPGWLGVSHAVKIESPVSTNAYRFWGNATIPTVPTTSAPLTNAFGFEIATDGKLYAVLYSAGTRTVVQDFSSATGNSKQPTDNNFHRYICYYRTDRVFWYIDSLNTPAASSSFPVGPTVQTLPTAFISIAGATPPASSAVITSAGLAVWDTGKNNISLSDGKYGFRKSKIDQAGRLAVKNGDIASFNASVTLPRLAQISADWYNAITSNNVATSTSGGATITQSSGALTIATTTATTVTASIQTNSTIQSSSSREVYAKFAAAFSTPTSANTNLRGGIYDTSNGFFVGYNGTSFGVTVRNNSSDTFVNKSSFNLDPLDGSIYSNFTRNGAPEAVNFALENLYRIRYGWGVAPAFFEIMSPDGEWVPFHVIRQPNLSASPIIQNPLLPIRFEAIKASADATNSTIITTSWDAGVVASPATERTGVGTISALNGDVTATAIGTATVSFNITGTWTGTLIFEGTIDNLNWVTLVGTPVLGLVTTATLGNGYWAINSGSFSKVRVRASAWTSGTASVAWESGVGARVQQVYNLSNSNFVTSSWAFDGSGNAISSTLINSKQRLDVNSASDGVTGSATPFQAQFIAGKDISGNLQPVPSNSIDASNSSTATLTAGSTFTGTWVDVTNYSNATVFVISDQASATDGLKLEFSTDGTNLDDSDLYTIPASNGQQISVALPTRYFRVRYTNGGTNQTSFRLQTKLHATRPKPSSQRVGTSINNEQDAEVVVAANARLALTASSPTTVSAGVASGTLIAANTSRKGLVVINTSSLGTVSLNLAGGTAVLSSGITLYPHDAWYMDEWTFTTAQINVIASLAATSVAVQELT